MFPTKFNVFLSSPYVLLVIPVISSQKVQTFENDFCAITNFDGLDKFYEETRKNASATRSSLEGSPLLAKWDNSPFPPGSIRSRIRNKSDDRLIVEETEEDRKTKKQICESFWRSGYFLRRGLEPVDIDTIYEDLEMTDRFDRKNWRDKISLMDDYDKRMDPPKFRFPTKSITFRTGSARMREFAFACVIERERTGNLFLYYISSSYKLNLPTYKEFRVRFICHMHLSVCNLSGMSEVPSTAFARSEFSLNDIYQQMRKFYIASLEPAQDPLCKLDKVSRLRVCTSAMSSYYFANKIIFYPEMKFVGEECQLRNVSFRPAETSETRKPYKEWMLSCQVACLTSNAHPTYYISRAYQSHYAIVYVEDKADKQMYIENISGDIGPIIEKDMTICEECQDLPPPILADELKKAQQKAD